MKRFYIDERVFVGDVVRWNVGKNVSSMGNDIVTYTKRDIWGISEISFASTVGKIFARRSRRQLTVIKVMAWDPDNMPLGTPPKSMYNNDNEMGLQWTTYALMTNMIDKNDLSINYWNYNTLNIRDGDGSTNINQFLFTSPEY